MEANKAHGDDELVVLKTIDQYSLIRICGANGTNYGVYTQDILNRLAAWSQICTFDVVGASSDWVALQFSRLPERICAFADEIYLFCPDTVEQGVGLIRESRDPERFAAARRLCPEVATKAVDVEELLKRAEGKLPREEFQRFRRGIESVKAHSTPSDMGVRLLAYQLTKTKYLFLWWD